ncbi:MAG: hypothetical protein MIO90_00870 [Methanomassiliicoccales archaeon]|nr:hypothetical protein [Methanomassiliicoccales archaeon]
MPELPEVEMAKRFVEGRALGRTLVRLEVLDRRMLGGGTEDDMHDLEGQRLQTVERHGKNLFLNFGKGVLHVHLGMSGSVLFCKDRYHHSSHERLRLNLDRGVLLLDDPRRFGRFGWAPSMADFVAMKGLGPDALTITEREFVERLTRKKSAIKAVLLDQHVLAGLGNLYVDEVLFQMGICPRTPASVVPQEVLEGLWRAVGDVLDASLKAETDFQNLPRGYLLRQREKGGMCPRCGHALSSTMVGGRTTIFCPNCQKERCPV